MERGEHALTSLDWTYAKPRELLFYLLSHPPRSKEQIGLDLWPEASTAQLRRNFHITLHRLRRALGRSEWIVFEKGSYAFNRSLSYFLDVKAFESSLAEARRTQAAEDEPGRAIPSLEEAVDLYRGDFLEDSVESEWAMIRQEELRREYLKALVALGRSYFASGRFAEAAEVNRRAIGHDGYLEEAHRGLCAARRLWASVDRR